MFGKWAYGFWQSKERYIDAKELTDVVAEYRMRRLPLDVIVQDWRYWGENNMWSSMEFDPKVYPEPAKTLEKLHTLFHVHYVISIWPALGRDTKIFRELNEKGLTYLPVHWSSGYLYDAFNPQARDIYWRYISDGLMAKGVDGLWMDATEPELADQHTFEESETNIKKFGNTALGPIAVYLNPYSLMTTEGVYGKWRKDFPDKRVLILTRSAFAGQQRNAAITWSGDINASYSVFRRQISAGLNFCMAGIPYWTTDIGAFFLKGHDKGFGPGEYPGGCKDPSYKELYVRWFEFGAFCPVFRSHGTHSPREVWQFGDVGDWNYEAMSRFLHLRYRLMPYIYSVAWKVTSEGYTMMRGLPMDFARDKNVYEIDNQYMFGPSILVTPVTEEQYFPKDTTRTRLLDDPDSVSLYLPAGTDWFDFWTGTRLQGGTKMTRETPIDIIPLYVRAGSIIPMGPFLQYAEEKSPDPIELRLYSGTDAMFTLYEDEGDNYNYENGKYTTIDFAWDHENATLTIGKRKGNFAGMLQTRIFKVVIVSPNHGTGLEITTNPEKIISYSGEMVAVK
ncbi:MAG: TIM-barrel domain-containing protein [bacterium]